MLPSASQGRTVLNELTRTQTSRRPTPSFANPRTTQPEYCITRISFRRVSCPIRGIESDITSDSAFNTKARDVLRRRTNSVIL